jgi:hypothetical protein
MVRVQFRWYTIVRRTGNCPELESDPNLFASGVRVSYVECLKITQFVEI